MLFDKIPRSVFPGFQPVDDPPPAVLPFHPANPILSRSPTSQNISESALLKRGAASCITALMEAKPLSYNEYCPQRRGELFKEAQNWAGHIVGPILHPVVPVSSFTPSGQKFH